MNRSKSYETNHIHVPKSVYFEWIRGYEYEIVGVAFRSEEMFVEDGDPARPFFRPPWMRSIAVLGQKYSTCEEL